MDATMDAARIRAEAIREFAEELKARSETEYYHDVETNRIVTYRLVYVDDIDDLVAEMTGETENN
jgi:hypothetical protein